MNEFDAMMKYMVILTAVLVVLVVATGCADTTTSLKSEDGQMAELYRLRAENARLRAMGGGDGSGGEAPMPDDGSFEAMSYGPPQGVAMAYRDPDWCDGTLKVQFRNRTSFYVQIFLDSEELSVNDGAGGVFDHTIPPRTDVYVCLDDLGTHQISGIAYTRRGQQRVEVEQFDVTKRWGIPAAGSPYTPFFLTSDLFKHN